jgi:hypothetical protein
MKAKMIFLSLIFGGVLYMQFFVDLAEVLGGGEVPVEVPAETAE